MSREKLNVFIAGGRGFIGKNLVEYLSEAGGGKYTLFFPYHNELELLDAEKAGSFIRGNKIDITIFCANVGGSRKTGYDDGRTDVVSKDLRMFFNVARHRDRMKRIIFLGSGAEYDRAHYKPFMPEDYFDTYVPRDDYGFSKYVCSKYIINSTGMVNLRLFGVFGKYEDYEFKFISNSIVKNLLGLPIVINQNVRFDYLYVNDLVKVIEYFIDHNPGHKAYNASTGKTIDLVTIAEKINRISQKPSEIIIKNKGMNTEYSGDNKRLLTEIGGFRFTAFDEALKELYGWYRSNIDKIDKRAIEKDEYIKYCHTRKDHERTK